jgi:hypothetical protein
LRYRRTRGPFCKTSRSAELTGTLTTVRSDLDHRMRIELPRTATCGRRKTSGDGHAGERRCAAADLASEDRNRSAVHDLARGFHRDKARSREKLAREARSTRVQRRRHAARWGGAVLRRNDDEPVSTTRSTGTATSCTGDFLTLRRSSGAASRLRIGDSGKDLWWRRNPRVSRQRRLGSAARVWGKGASSGGGL